MSKFPVLFYRLNNPAHSLLSYKRCSHPLIIFAAFHWTHSSMSMSFSYSPELGPGLEKSDQNWEEGKHHLLQPAGNTVPNVPLREWRAMASHTPCSGRSKIISFSKLWTYRYMSVKKHDRLEDQMFLCRQLAYWLLFLLLYMACTYSYLSLEVRTQDGRLLQVCLQKSWEAINSPQ